MPQCAGIKRDGGRCTAIVGPSQTHCYQHDPARAAERRRNASRAGRTRGTGEIADLKKQLKDLAADVLAGTVERGDAAGKRGRPPAWPELEMDPDYVEQDPAMERDMDEIEAKVEKYGELLPELLGRLERDLATEALAVWEGFCGFCEEEMEISPEKLLQATFAPALVDVGWFGELVGRLELARPTRRPLMGAGRL